MIRRSAGRKKPHTRNEKSEGTSRSSHVSERQTATDTIEKEKAEEETLKRERKRKNNGVSTQSRAG